MFYFFRAFVFFVFVFIPCLSRADIASVSYIRNKIAHEWGIVLPQTAGSIASYSYLMSAIDISNFALNGTATNYTENQIKRIVSESSVNRELEKIKYCVPGTYLSQSGNDCIDCGIGHYCIGGDKRKACTYGAISCNGTNHEIDAELPPEAAGKINKILTLDEVNAFIPETDISQWEHISTCYDNDFYYAEIGCGWSYNALSIAMGCASGTLGVGTYLFIIGYFMSAHNEQIAVFDHPVGYKSVHICNWFAASIDLNNPVYQSHVISGTPLPNGGGYASNSHNTNIVGAEHTPFGISVYRLK